MSTFDQLTTAVTDHQFAPAKYSSFVQDKLNEAQTYMAAQVDFRELFTVQNTTTTTGTASYSLPADLLRIDSLTETDTNNLNQLEQIPFADYDLLDTTTRGRPTQYSIDRSNLKLYPTPDASTYTFQLRYYKIPTTMISGSTPEIPSAYHHCLIDYALSKAYAREHQLDLAQYHWQRFQEDLAKARGEIQHATNDANQTQVIDGMWASDTSWVPDMRISS